MAAADRDGALQSGKEAIGQRDAAQSARDELRQTLYATDLQMAASLWQAKDRGRTLEVLERHRPKAGEPDLRGFNWHFQNRECRSGQRSLELPVGLKRFSADGTRILVSMYRDKRTDGKNINSIKEWDLKTGREIRDISLSAEDESAGGFFREFSSDGKRVIVSGRVRGPDGGETYWNKVIDVESRRELFAVPATGGTPLLRHDFLLDGEGRRMVEIQRSLPEDKVQSFRVWDVDRGQLLHTVELDSAKFENFSFGYSLHPNGKRFAAVVHKIVQGRPVPTSYELRIWNLDTGKEASRDPMEKNPGAGYLRYSPTGDFLARSAIRSGVVELRDPETGQVLHELNTPTTANAAYSNSLTFSPDGTWLAAEPFGASSVSVWKIDANRLATDRSPVRAIGTSE